MARIMSDSEGSDASDPVDAEPAGPVVGAAVVRVDYRKFDGSAHRHYPAMRLGEDEHGSWLGVPADFIRNASPDTFKYADPYVLLVPRHAWWTAMFNAPPRRTEIYCDVTTPALWSGDSVRVADLDLDVRRRRDEGAVELLDEDEFEMHRLRFGYPPDVVVAAWSAARWLMSALLDRTEPFGSGYRYWLDQVR
jgi:protein associated with RNAse G/E